MPFADLQSFAAELERRGQLKRVAAEVDAELEITEIADRVMKMPSPEGPAGAPPTDPVHGGRGGHALLFERVTGSDIPVLINAFGSYRRVGLALGCDNLEELGQRVERLIKPELPATLMAKLRKLPDLMRLSSYAPKVVARGVCQEVVHTDDADLGMLPALKCWPQDGGRYITLGGIVTRSLQTGQDNVGMYRVQIMEPKLAAMHWHMHHDGARHWRMYERAGQKMPLAVVLGGPSVLPYAATCPLPPDVSELLMAGFLSNAGLELVKCRTNELHVPASAEIVIEGYIDPADELILEGPFGDHTGFYSLADHFPRVHVTAITHRRNAVYPATIVGLPPMEDYYFGKATERIFLPLFKMLAPDVIDYHLPMFGTFHHCMFVKIRKEYPYQARRVINAIWGSGQMALTKFVVVVDETVNVHDEQDVLFHLCANVDPRRDTFLVDGPLDILDHATPYCGAGSKMGIDATRKIRGEGEVREWPDLATMTRNIQERVDRRWPEYGLDG